jgi:hypothetical protein
VSKEAKARGKAEAQSIFDAMVPSEREIALRAKRLRRLVIFTMSETAGYYGRLKPDGRELDDDERTATRARLETGAMCLRSVARDWDIIEFLVRAGEQTRQDLDLRPAVGVLRMMQRSLILALSEDDERRERVAPTSELAPLVRSVIEALPG